MFCHKCGTQLKEDVNFCPKCGAPVVLSKETLQVSAKESTAEMMPKKRARKFPILIVIIVLFLGIVVAAMIGKKPDEKKYVEFSDPVKEQSGGNSNVQEKVNLTETFTDYENGITFRYPAEWVILDSTGELNIVEMLDSENTADRIVTFHVNIIFDQDPYGVYTQSKDTVQKNVNEYGEFLDLSETQFGSVPVKVLKYQRSGLNSDDIVTMFWYKLDEEVYQVTCSCTASAIDTYEPIFEAVLDSYTVNMAMPDQEQEEIFGFETDYSETYADKVRELSAKDSTLQYALIDLIDNGVPELVVDHSGYDVSVYTWIEEEAVALMDQWSYGAMGNAGYEYLPGQNVIRNYNMESAGAVVYESYMEVNDAYEVVSIYDEDLSIRHVRDVNGDGLIDEDEYSEEELYYLNETEISKEEYASYQIVGDYEPIKGSMSADAMIGLLQGDENQYEDTMAYSDVSIEDCYRLAGIYSDSIEYTQLSFSIYTSQEEGETAIGTAVLYKDNEEIYLGEIIPLEKGVYKIDVLTEDEIIMEETKGDGIILLLYENGEYIDAYRMIEHYES